MQGLRREPVEPALRVGAQVDQTRRLQPGQVLGDAGLSHAEGVDQFADRPLPVAQQRQDALTGRIGEGFEDR